MKTKNYYQNQKESIQKESMKIIQLHHQQHRHLQLLMIQVVIKIKFIIQRQNTNIIQIHYVNLMNVVYVDMKVL